MLSRNLARVSARLAPRRAAMASAHSAAAPASAKPLLRGVVCDMDGTLVESVLDFAEMYRRVGVDRSQDILAVIASWEEPRRVAAHALIAEIEAEALSRMRLMAGAAALGAWCAARGVPMGLVTRNTAASVAHLHTHHWQPPLVPFAPAVARDDGLPHKPHPAALLRCAQAWGAEPSGCVMIGDSPRDDVVAGRRAGFHTILLVGDLGRHGAAAAAGAAGLEGEKAPHATALSMEEVPSLLERHFAVPPLLAARRA